MTTPNVTETPAGYTFLWPDHGIAIHTQRIHIHSRDGHVSGEVYIQAQNKDEMVTIYPPTSYNFSAIRTRKELANSLKTKNGKVPWEDMINQLCYGVTERARKGAPVIELCTVDGITPPEYVLKPLIVKHYPNVIFGDPSSFKSTVALIVSQVVMLPWADNPMGLTAPDKSHKSLYLDWETDAPTILWQTTLLRKGIPEMPEMFLQYRQCAAPLANDLDQIRLHILDTKAELIIIDSLGLAAGGELKETQSALGFFAALRTLNITSLILAHNSKDRETKVRSIYGNQFFTAQARNIWEVRKEQEAGSNEMSIALFHRKPPPFAGIHQPLGFKLEFTDSSMTIKPSDPKTIGEFLQQMGIQARIINHLKDGAMTVDAITRDLDSTSNNIRVALSALKKKGKVVTINKGVWGLAELG